MLGIGDDAAVVPTNGFDRILIATDTLLEGIHFDADASAESIGHKAIAVNLSDIAAMGGIPTAATVAITASTAWPQERLDHLMIGLQRTAHDFSVAVVGGDTTSWNGALAITVTVVGTPGPGGAITRSGGQPGDLIFVTGPLGGSIEGHHLTFIPRVREALAIVERVDVHAMIDISDGLASDIRHMAASSGCGAVIDAARIPIRDGIDSHVLEHALSDGEDFELLFAVSPSDRSKVPGFCTEIGWLDSAAGIRLRNRDGEMRLESLGYSHSLESGGDA